MMMNTESSRCPIVVLGIGNILLCDEGIGVRVIEQLQKIPLPKNVELIDGGTGGADLIDVVAERQKIIIVDSVQTEGESGTILKFTMDGLLPPDSGVMSLHSLGIPEALKMTKLLGCEPKEVIVIGIKPKSIGCGLKLSNELSRQIPRIIESILLEIDKSQSKVA